MQFNTHYSYRQELEVGFKTDFGITKQEDLDGIFLKAMSKNWKKPKDDSELADQEVMRASLIVDKLWTQSRRPFYNVYPGVVECLKNTSLDFTVKDLDIEIEPTAICFAKGHELNIEGNKVKTALLFISKHNFNVDPQTAFVRSSLTPSHIFFTSFAYESGRIDVLLSTAAKLSFVNGSDSASLVSVCVGVAMLSSDPRFVEPILLKRDQQRCFQTEIEKGKAIDRARRRGINGFAIGKMLDASPHIRRPHFGIRWTQKGRSTPKLVPVAGCLVSRSKLYPIPTGYLDDQDKLGAVQ